MEQAVVPGIVVNCDEAKISVLGVPGKRGLAREILGAVANANVEVGVIIQNVNKDGKPTSASPCTAMTTPAPWTCSRRRWYPQWRRRNWWGTPPSAR